MKQFILILIVFTALVSCDGRYHKHKTNKDVLRDSNLLDSFSQNISYFPLKYTEKATDTILSNGLRIKIKHYSLDTTAVLNEFKIDTINYKHFFRRFAAEISIISKNGTSVFEKKVTKTTISLIDKNNEPFLKDAIMRFVEIDQINSLKESKVIVNIWFCKPKTNDCLFYKLIVTENGTYQIKKTNDS